MMKCLTLLLNLETSVTRVNGSRVVDNLHSSSIAESGSHTRDAHDGRCHSFRSPWQANDAPLAFENLAERSCVHEPCDDAQLGLVGPLYGTTLKVASRIMQIGANRVAS